MPRPRAATTVRKTPNFDFIFGRYSYSNTKIPYFQVSMSFGDAAEYLSLVNEMPGAASMNWRVEELFQRDIDWGRVERKIVPYLRQQDQPQFFNSLTIALLPFRNEEIRNFDGGEDWEPPELEDREQFADGATRAYGPISCGYWSHWENPDDDGARLGQLCWNSRQVCGIAIDGQHRLAAIKQIAHPGGGHYDGTSVPVILVVLDPQLGFTGDATRENLIGTLRSLFIDLNKHAKTVSRARQILLDDRDPASICVRQIVGSSLTTGTDELDDTPPRLPLSLVDWHSEQARFDTGAYLTTILGVDWIVAKTLGIKPFQDMMAFEETNRLIGRLERKLEIELEEATRRLDDCRRYQRPFTFVDEELEQIADGFARRWSAPLVHVLSALKPYRELIELRANRGTFRPEFANWAALKQHAEDARGETRASDLLKKFESHLGNRNDDPIPASDLNSAIEDCEDLKENRQLAFTVVFQRALALALLQFSKISQNMTEGLSNGDALDLDDVLGEEDDEDNGEDTGDDAVTGVELQRAEELVEALNVFIQREPEALNAGFEFPLNARSADRLWLCSFVAPEGPIDFTQGASKRGSDLLILIGMLWLYRRNEDLGESDFKSLMERADNADSGFDLKLSQCLGRMYLADSSIAGRILAARELDDDQDNRWEQIRVRAKWIWSVLCR